MPVSGTRRPKVLLIHNFLVPSRVSLFAELARRLDLEVWILGDVQSVRDWPSDAPGAEFHFRVMPHVTVPLGSRYNVILLNWTLPFALARRRYDAIICCAWDTPATFYASYHARLTGVPFILWSGSTAAENTWLRRMTGWLVRGLVRRADAWLAYGTRAKEYLVSLGADAERTYLAFNTVDIAGLRELSGLSAPELDAWRVRAGVAARRVILYCGNLLELKGVSDLLEAFGAYARTEQDAILILVGSGRDEPRYRAWVEARDLTRRVRFAGFAQRDTIARYYAVSDLLVLPSRSEVWGLVINEALACGVPVVATDVCGAVADLLEDGVNGYVVPSRNPAALCEVFKKHFQPGTDREGMARAARRSIEPFTIARAADAFEAAVARVCGAR